MSNEVMIVGVAGFSVLMLVSSLWFLRQTRRQERFAARVLLARGAPPAVKKTAGAVGVRVAALRLLGGLGQAILRTGIVTPGTRAELERTLAASGLRGAQGVRAFIGAKILLMAALPLIVFLATSDLSLSPPVRKLLPMAGALIGLIAPDRIVAQRRASYIRRLEAGIPDTLDMMVICTQAGLGLGPTITRVTQELRGAYPEAAEELEKTANELQILADSRVAIAQLGSRTGVDSLKRLAATLIQSSQYGTPLSDALRVLSAELRQQMLNRAEARAARLPVMMTLPTIAFIMPCVFMIAGGPAIIQLIKAFSH